MVRRLLFSKELMFINIHLILLRTTKLLMAINVSNTLDKMAVVAPCCCGGHTTDGTEKL